MRGIREERPSIFMYRVGLVITAAGSQAAEKGAPGGMEHHKRREEENIKIQRDRGRSTGSMQQSTAKRIKSDESDD